jgi:catechol 2,3-dioxygenase
VTASTKFSAMENAPSRAFGVHSLERFCLTVPDLTAAARFYSAFGLEVREDHLGIQLFTQHDQRCWGNLREGNEKRLDHISFGAYADDMPRFRVNLEERGIECLEPPSNSTGASIWFRDHDGNLIEIAPTEKSSPFAKSAVNNFSSASGVRGASTRSESTEARPRRLAHVGLFCSDLQQSTAFYTDILGLRLSDEAGVIAFLRGIHGSDHHVIALIKSDGPGFHHVSWDMASIHEVGLGAQQMANAGYRAGWGLGRHVLGSNYFHYVRDPWGSYCEFSADIDYIADGQLWHAGHFTPEDGFFLWGPEPPADFGTNYELRPLVR